MKHYVLMLRGINVGGKNKLPMAQLRLVLEQAGFENVATYIQSGNVILQSKLSAKVLAQKVESLLTQNFQLDSQIVRVLALDRAQYKNIMSEAPKDFGDNPARYRYNVLFLIDVSSDEAMKQLEARPGVDTLWQGNGAVYYRVPALTHPDATKSWLGRITQKPLYKLVTIRNWNTSKKLLELLNAR